MRNPIGAAGISLIACALAASAWAGAGSDGAAFLQLPLGARAAALGGAYDALATDAYAPAWNPAGLAFEPSASVSASYLSYLDAMSYDAFSAAVPLRNGGDGGVAAPSSTSIRARSRPATSPAIPSAASTAITAPPTSPTAAPSLRGCPWERASRAFKPRSPASRP